MRTGNRRIKKRRTGNRRTGSRRTRIRRKINMIYSRRQGTQE